MKTPTHSSIRVSLEMGMIAFFILAVLSLLVVYLADPSIDARAYGLWERKGMSGKLDRWEKWTCFSLWP